MQNVTKEYIKRLELRSMSTADTWDSYNETMVKVFDLFQPKRCLEWGIGTSTDTILGRNHVFTLDSVEHSPKWFNQYKDKRTNRFNLILEKNQYLYPLVSGRFSKYDFIFVDGILREQCLDNAYSLGTIVMLHDAERRMYKDHINKYSNIFYTDGGHTVTMTNDKDVGQELKLLIGETCTK